MIFYNYSFFVIKCYSFHYICIFKCKTLYFCFMMGICLAPAGSNDESLTQWQLLEMYSCSYMFRRLSTQVLKNGIEGAENKSGRKVIVACKAPVHRLVLQN